MENKVKKRMKLRVAGFDFTVISAEDESYTRDLAARVDKDIKDTCRAAITSVTGATILSALNYCDSMQKDEIVIADLKKQLSAYLEEIVELKAACVDAERENEKLRAEVETLKSGLHAMAMSAGEGQSMQEPVRGRFAMSEYKDAGEDVFATTRIPDFEKYDKRDRRDRRSKK